MKDEQILCDKCGKKAKREGFVTISLYECPKCGKQKIWQKSDIAKLVYQNKAIEGSMTISELFELLTENKKLKVQYAKGFQVKIDLLDELDEREKKQ